MLKIFENFLGEKMKRPEEKRLTTLFTPTVNGVYAEPPAPQGSLNTTVAKHSEFLELEKEKPWRLEALKIYIP